MLVHAQQLPLPQINRARLDPTVSVRLSDLSQLHHGDLCVARLFYEVPNPVNGHFPARVFSIISRPAMQLQLHNSLDNSNN